MATTTVLTAPASAESSSSSPSSNPGSSHGLTAGAVAGTAIGCAVVGAGLAFALLILLGWRRSGVARHRKEPTHHKEDLQKHEKHQRARDRAGATKPLLPSAAMTTLPRNSIEPFLPQQADDATVRQRYLVIFDQIGLHVDNFYAEQTVELNPEQEGELSRFGTRSMTMPLAGLFQSSHRKKTIIKHCLAFHAMSLVTPSNSSESLLPHELSVILSPRKAQTGRQVDKQRT